MLKIRQVGIPEPHYLSCKRLIPWTNPLNLTSPENMFMQKHFFGCSSFVGVD